MMCSGGLRMVRTALAGSFLLVLALWPTVSLGQVVPHACDGASSTNPCAGRHRYCVEGQCYPNRQTYGFFQTQWRRWPVETPEIARPPKGPQAMDPSRGPGAETPPPDMEADPNPEFQHLRNRVDGQPPLWDQPGLSQEPSMTEPTGPEPSTGRGTQPPPPPKNPFLNETGQRPMPMRDRRVEVLRSRDVVTEGLATSPRRLPRPVRTVADISIPFEEDLRLGQRDPQIRPASVVTDGHASRDVVTAAVASTPPQTVPVSQVNPLRRRSSPPQAAAMPQGTPPVPRVDSTPQRRVLPSAPRRATGGGNPLRR